MSSKDLMEWSRSHSAISSWLHSFSFFSGSCLVCVSHPTQCLTRSCRRCLRQFKVTRVVGKTLLETYDSCVGIIDPEAIETRSNAAMSERRTIVLALVHYYLPGFKAGGPIRSISNLVERLGDEFDLRIIAADRDFREDTPYTDVVIEGWNQVGKAQVYYLSAGLGSLRSLLRLISDTPHDVLYLNSFFDPAFTQLPLWMRWLRLLKTKPIILAPRGELAPRSLSRKAWKKFPFMVIASSLGLYADLTWQASTEHEARDIRRAMGKTARRTTIAPIVIAQDLPPLPEEDAISDRPPKRDGHQPLRLIFLARVSPSKNLDHALRILTRVRMPVDVTINGPIDDKAYWRACQRLMTKLPANISVQYAGVVAHSDVAR